MTGSWRILKAESGSVLVLVLIAFPMLLAALGLVVDSGVLYMEKLRLQAAAEAAALAAVDGYDPVIWATQRRVVLVPSEAAALAEGYFARNFRSVPGLVSGRVASVLIDPIKSNEVRVMTEAVVQPTVARVFGVGPRTLYAQGKAAAR